MNDTLEQVNAKKPLRNDYAVLTRQHNQRHYNKMEQISQQISSRFEPAQTETVVLSGPLARISHSLTNSSALDYPPSDMQPNDMRMSGEKKLDSSLQDTTRVFRHPGIQDTIIQELQQRPDSSIPFHAMLMGVGYQSKIPHSPQTDEISLAMQGHDNICLTLADNNAHNLRLAQAIAFHHQIPALQQQMDAAKPEQLQKNSLDILVCTNTLIYPFKTMGRVQRAKVIGGWVDRLKPQGKLLIDLPSLALVVSSSQKMALDICQKLSSPSTVIMGTGMIQKLLNKQLAGFEHEHFSEIKLKAIIHEDMPDPTILVTRAYPMKSDQA